MQKTLFAGIFASSQYTDLLITATEKFDYVFSENGLTYHRNNKLVVKTVSYPNLLETWISYEYDWYKYFY